MKRFLHTGLYWGFALFVLGISWVKPCAAGEPAPALKVLAAIATGKEDRAASRTFKILLRVENISGKPQIVHTASCSWPGDWRTDTPDVSLDLWNCEKNISQTIEIAPGGFFTDELEIISHLSSKGTVSFRMGFNPENGRKPVWSNTVYLEFEPGPVPPSTPKPAAALWGRDARSFPAGKDAP